MRYFPLPKAYYNALKKIPFNQDNFQQQQRTNVVDQRPIGDSLTKWIYIKEKSGKGWEAQAFRSGYKRLHFLPLSYWLWGQADLTSLSFSVFNHKTGMAIGCSNEYKILSTIPGTE